MQLLGVACLGGIGFTMSLFIAHLAFADHGQLVSAKIGIMAASFISAVAGYWILWQTARVDPRT
jgi:NhaA family Na+:H+ antiporter